MLKRFIATLVAILCLLSACASPTRQPINDDSAPSVTLAPSTPSAPSPTTTPSPTSSPTEASTFVPTETAVTETASASAVTPETEASPDSAQEFAFISPQTQLQIGTLDGETRTVWDGSEVTEFAWSPEGDKLAFVAQGALYLWTAASGEAEVVMEQPRSIGEPSWSADDKQIAITTSESETADCYDDSPCYIMLIDTETGQRQSLGLGVNPRFAPTRNAVLAGTLPLLSPQMREGEWSAPIIWPSPDTSPSTIEDAANTASWTRTGWSADGTVAAANNVVLDANGAILERIAEPSGEVANQDAPTIANGLAPDGRYVALATLTITATDDGFLSDTTLSLLDRTNQQRRNLWRYDENAATSSTSLTTKFVSTTNHTSMTGHGRIWRVSPVRWSPDGLTLAFTGCGESLADDGERGCGLWLASGDGTKLRLVAETVGAEGVEQSLHAPLYSSDGSMILFTLFDRSSNEGFTIWTISTLSGQAARQVADGNNPQWRP